MLLHIITTDLSITMYLIYMIIRASDQNAITFRTKCKLILKLGFLSFCLGMHKSQNTFRSLQSLGCLCSIQGLRGLIKAPRIIGQGSGTALKLRDVSCKIPASPGIWTHAWKTLTSELQFLCPIHIWSNSHFLTKQLFTICLEISLCSVYVILQSLVLENVFNI